jgi:hypothetical protein
MLMKKNEITFIKIVNAYINNDLLVLPDDTDWEQIVKLAKIHSMCSIVAAMNHKYNFDMSKELSNKLDGYMMAAVVQSVSWDRMYKEVSEALATDKINNIVVKGPIVKRYYPDSDLRTMGDIDLIVHKNDIQKASEVMIKLGFNECESGSIDEWKFERNNLLVELHEDLTSENFGTGVDYKTEMQYIFNNVKNPNVYIQELTDECHLVYLILHIAQHLLSAGCGVRQVLDIALVLKNCDIDMNSVYADLERLKLTDLAHAIFYLCNVWFGVKCEDYVIDEDLYETISDHILSGGVFGFAAGRDANKQLRNSMQEKSKLKIVFKYAFPPAEEMRAYVVWFRNKPSCLLPIAWIYRWIKHFVIDHPEKISNFFKKSVNSSDKQVEKEYEMLKKLGFYQK